MAQTTTRAYTRADGVELKEHLECRLAALQEYTETRLCSIEKATELARIAMENRLNGMNEFRQTLQGQAGRMATRNELSVQVDRINADIAELKKYKATMEGKASQSSVMIALLISVAGLVITIVRWLVGG